MSTRPAFTDFLLRHVLLIPGSLAMFAMLAQHGGLDQQISAWLFDPTTASFPARTSDLLEMFGHRLAKNAVSAIWLLLLGLAVHASLTVRLRDSRTSLWAGVLAMALGPSVVVMLKELNAYHCPWDLKPFGGYADFASGWFVAAADIGHCFPSGHAAGGFSLVALYFLGLQLELPRVQRLGLWLTLAAGSLFSLIRLAQGAHFLSHNLWSAAICWCAAALVFLPLLAGSASRLSLVSR